MAVAASSSDDAVGSLAISLAGARLQIYLLPIQLWLFVVDNVDKQIEGRGRMKKLRSKK